MENQVEPHYRGGWVGPAAAVVLIAIALFVLGLLELGLMATLTHS
jgi:hypothetical protein